MMNYIFFNNGVKIILENERFLFISFTPESGKVFFRYKIDTISNVKHPGIFVGVDEMGRRWFMHNHYENGKPTLDVEQKFSKNQPLYISSEPYINDPLEIVRKGLDETLKRKPYSWLNYNCQTFVNLVSNNKSKSEDVENWVGRVAVGLALFAVIRSS